MPEKGQPEVPQFQSIYPISVEAADDAYTTIWHGSDRWVGAPIEMVTYNPDLFGHISTVANMYIQGKPSRLNSMIGSQLYTSALLTHRAHVFEGARKGVRVPVYFPTAKEIDIERKGKAIGARPELLKIPGNLPPQYQARYEAFLREELEKESELMRVLNRSVDELKVLEIIRERLRIATYEGAGNVLVALQAAEEAERRLQSHTT